MKDNRNNPQEDLQAIREIMERSSRFLSLSGLSGVFAGIMALLGASAAWFFILDQGRFEYEEHLHGIGHLSFPGNGFFLALDALVVLMLAVTGAVYFSYRKARKAGQGIWTPVSRRLIINLLIPLVSGGIFSLILIYHNNIELLASAMLIFYGLSLVNAGKFTFGEIHYLGLTQIALGILAGIFTDYGLLLWAIGFGLMHIVYGLVMFYKYESIGRRA